MFKRLQAVKPSADVHRQTLAREYEQQVCVVANTDTPARAHVCTHTSRNVPRVTAAKSTACSKPGSCRLRWRCTHSLIVGRGGADVGRAWLVQPLLPRFPRTPTPCRLIPLALHSPLPTQTMYGALRTMHKGGPAKGNGSGVASPPQGLEGSQAEAQPPSEGGQHTGQGEPEEPGEGQRAKSPPPAAVPAG